MSKLQFNHLATIIEGSIHVDEKISISEIAQDIAKTRGRSFIYRFLSDLPWDNEILNHNKLAYIKHHMKHNLLSEDMGFLVIDDTVN